MKLKQKGFVSPHLLLIVAVVVAVAVIGYVVVHHTAYAKNFTW